jgi:hypothetical protein
MAVATAALGLSTLWWWRRVEGRVAPAQT